MSRKQDPLELFDQHEGRNPQLLLDKCLVQACVDGDVDTVIDLLQKGASVEGESYTENKALSGENYITPLMGAATASKQQWKISNLLLENGANVNKGDRYNVTPLHVAAVHGQRDCVRLFIDSGANVNTGTLDHDRPGVYRKPYKRYSTPLHVAVRDSQVACVEELIAHGHADYNRRDAEGCTCLNWAAQGASEECVALLVRLSEGDKIFSFPMPGTGDYPLHDCVRRDFIGCVRELLLRGADVNQQNAIGLTPLHFAALKSQNYTYSSEMMEMLVTYSRDLDVDRPVGGCGLSQYRHGMSGMKALQLVAFEPDIDPHQHNFHTAEFRLSRTFKLITSDPRRPTRRPWCAVHLIRYGADFNISYQGRTLLQHEAYRNHDNNDHNDPNNDLLLTALVRAAGVLPIPARPPGMLADEVGTKAQQKLKWLRELFASPRSLQQCCRVAIRRILGSQRLGSVAELPIPTSLHEYLLLKT